jgi:hypothetical protein
MFNLSNKQKFYFEASFFTFMLVYLMIGWDQISMAWRGFSVAFITYLLLNTVSAWRQWTKEKP